MRGAGLPPYDTRHVQMYVAIPLLPLVYPFIWFNTNAIGVARVLGLYDSLLETPHYKSCT